MVFCPGSTDGASFAYNFLLFGNNILDQNSFFVKDAASTAWLNYPSDFEGTTWIGIRLVYNLNNTHVLVEIHETYPVPGRIWSNFYNVSQWTGWKSIIPQ